MWRARQLDKNITVPSIMVSVQVTAKKERNGDVSWLIKPIRYRIQNGIAHTISYSHQSIDEKKYMVNIEKT